MHMLWISLMLLVWMRLMVLMVVMNDLTFKTMMMILIMILMMMLTMILMMILDIILMMILMMVGAGTCILSKFPGENLCTRVLTCGQKQDSGILFEKIIFTMQNSLWGKRNYNIGPFSEGGLENGNPARTIVTLADGS